MERWVEIRKSADFIKMGSDYGISPITARILRNRDLTAPGDIRAFLNPGESALHDPMMHLGMNRVVQVLSDKISESCKIRIIGDYDVDGICATLILYKGLTFLGANADYRIPHRITDGYGINERLIKEAYDDGCDTIVTCDNGISAKSQTDYANDLGVTMVITDHHEVPFEMINGNKEYILPNADAIVDPKLPGERYPFSGICGAYVAYQTVIALGQKLGKTGNSDFEKIREELIEFAALATVCDIMELKDENRSLVCVGMKYMQNSKNLGMRELLKATGVEGKVLTPYTLGFVIGPCINATGRLDSPMRAMELFLETDPSVASRKAAELKSLNEERKDMTLKETERAFEIVDSRDHIDDVLVVYLPDCHESLAGIIAGKVREKYTRPSFVITKTEAGLKGSGRGIDAYDMYEGLTEVKEYLSKFGGHKLAAGLSLPEENLEAFTKALNENSKLSENDFYETVRIDMIMPFEYASLSLARELSVLEPFGTGNDKPLFAATGVKIIQGSRIGKNKNVGKYKVADSNNRIFEMIYFGDLDKLERFTESIYDKETAEKLHSGDRVSVVLDICYELSINEFNGRESAQIQMKWYR